jgi:hypothetical protein
VILLIAAGLGGYGFTINSRPLLLIDTVIWALWFVLLFAIATPLTEKYISHSYKWLRRGALIIFITIIISGIVEVLAFFFIIPGYVQKYPDTGLGRALTQMQYGVQYTDSTALCQQAVENLLQGENPYAHANIIQALIKYDASFDRVTPLRLGRFANVFPYPTEAQLQQLWNDAVKDPAKVPVELVSQVCYPAGSFLLPLPFIAVGINDIRWVYAIFAISGLAYATWRIPRGKRLLFIGAALISLALWNAIADGETGSIVFPLIIVAWLSLGENDWLSAIFMGLAVATKQTAWFLLPFYLILLWRKRGLKRMGISTGIIAVVFGAMNAYFFIQNPVLWVTSVLSPMIQPMFPIGGGIVTLTTSGLLNIQSQFPFAVLEALAFFASIIWYIRNCAKYPQTGPILAIVPFFFAWRSLWSYFFYMDLIVLAGILLGTKEKSDTGVTPSSPSVTN